MSKVIAMSVCVACVCVERDVCKCGGRLEAYKAPWPRLVRKKERTPHLLSCRCAKPGVGKLFDWWWATEEGMEAAAGGWRLW